MDISSSGRTQSGMLRDLHQVQELRQDKCRVQANDRQSRCDEVIISGRGQLLQRLREAVQQSPDVRAEKVAALREAIQQGTYDISPVEIAKAILASRTR